VSADQKWPAFPRLAIAALTYQQTIIIKIFISILKTMT
jgi:hypothetical protein